MNNVEWDFKTCDSIKPAIFQIIGVDVIIDSKYKAWMLEINNSPSLNIMFEKDFCSEEKELSEIDQEIKTPLLSDTLQLASLYRKDRAALDLIEEHNSLQKIYSDSVFDPESEFDIMQNLLIIYNKLTGTKGKAAIGSSQFAKLFTIWEYLRIGFLVKHDIPVIFSAIVGRYKTQMDFRDFGEAMFRLFKKYKGKLNSSLGNLILKL